MPKIIWTAFARRICRRELSLRFLFVLVMLVLLLPADRALAHEGHDHNKPPPLNMPVAARVVAVTPDYELVGVASGDERLTIFLHHFATGAPVKDAKLVVSAGEQETEAISKEDGVFQVTGAWLNSAEPLDLIFHLTLPDNQDILTGRLDRAVGAAAPAVPLSSNPLADYQGWVMGAGGMAAGVLLTLLLTASFARRRWPRSTAPQQDQPLSEPARESKSTVKQLHRAPLAVLALALLLAPDSAETQGTIDLPSVPATMATDAPQRMADGSLFVPKATQHLLSVRTLMTEESRAPRTIELVGTVIADPNGFGRVQAARPGRIEAPQGGLGFIGKRVQKGELLGYLAPYIEAADKANIESQIAEAEARIAKLDTILSRYRERPGSVPQVRMDEVEGEFAALRRKRAELQPSLVVREEIHAPVPGVVSAANVVPGQIVEARDVLFEIVDPARFWVEAIAHDTSVASKLRAAFAVTGEGEKLPLEFAGSGLSLKQQATPLTFRMTQSASNLSIGKPVTVLLQSSMEVSGIVLPAASVVRAPSGLAMVWVKTEAERFEPQIVRYEALDGQRVVVTAGLKPDLRVVTEGATLLNQIR